MFRDDKQACRAIRVLLSGLFHDVDALWTEAGPTPLALRNLEASPLSHGEHLMLQIAFDFWNGAGGAKFADILHVLDPQRIRAVFELVIAVDIDGAHAVEAWITKRTG